MAHPTSGTPVQTQFATSVTSMAVNMPAIVDSGDLLLAFVEVRNAGTWTVPTDWVEFKAQLGGSSVGELTCFYKIASGTEDGGTATWTASTGTSAIWQVIRITGWHGTTPPEAASAQGDYTTNPNPPSLSPSWGAEDTLWLEVAGNSATSTLTTGASTNYSGYQANTASSGGSQVNIASAYRQLNASSEDPGVFANAGNIRYWAAINIAIRPAAAGGGATDYPLVAQVTSFAQTNQSANLKLSRKLLASATSYTLSGVNILTHLGHKITASVTSFTLTNQNAILKLARKLIASVISYTQTNQSANLTKLVPGRYWVGGTGNWSDNANHWSDSSGGSPGATLPTSTDNVFVDENSGFGSGGTITLDVYPIDCNNFTSNSGHSYTIAYDEKAESLLTIYGSTVLESGITFSDSGIMCYPQGEETLTSNGAILPFFLMEDIGKISIQDNLVVAGQFYQDNGTFDANDHNVTASNFYFYADTGCTPTVIMGSGTWEATGSGWYIEEVAEVVTFTPETSTIKLSGGGSMDYNYDDFVEKTYNNLWITVGSSTTLFYRSNTFNNLKIDAGATVVFGNGTTQTISSLTAVGTLGNEIILKSSNSTTQFTLSKSSGVVECDYLDLSNSNATGGANWYTGSNSVNDGNNTGWIWGDVGTNYPLTTEVTAFTLSAQSVNLKKALKLITSVSEFLLTTTNSNLLLARKLISNTINFILTNNSVILRRGIMFIGIVGEFTLTTTNAIIRKVHKIVVESTSYSLTKTNTSLSVARKLLVSNGEFTLTTINAILKKAHKITTESIYYSLTQINSSLLIARKLLVSKGAFTLTTISNILIYGKGMIIATSAFILTGINILFSKRTLIGKGPKISINDSKPRIKSSSIILSKNSVFPDSRPKTKVDSELRPKIKI